MIRTATFANGVNVVTRRFPSQRSAALGVWLLNGVRHENANQQGYAHFLEHLLFKGIPDMDAWALADRFEAMGGEINAHTGRELTALHGLVPAEDLMDLLGLFIDMLLAPAFDSTDVDVEKEVVLQEMAMVQDNPEEALEDAAFRRAWPWHPMGRPVLGSRETISAATAADFRSYMLAQLTGGRVWIVAVGNVDHDAIVAACAPLALLPPGGGPETAQPRFTPGSHRRRGDWEQSHLLWVLPAPAFNDPSFHALVMANHILGGGASSRLFQEVREQRGLVYGIHSRLELYSDCGVWLIPTACDPHRRAECRKAVEETVEALIREGFDSDELEITRRHLWAGLVLEEDDPDGCMERLAREAIYLGRHPSLEDRTAALAAVSAEDVSRALARAWEERLFVETSS